MRDVHLVLHAPQGDTYADLLFTMIEREGRRPPVTWTTFQARDLGSSTAEMVIETLQGACERYQPQVLLVAESCTGELIQDQPGALAKGAGLSAPIIPIEMAAYTRKENWGASETFYQLVRGLLASRAPKPGEDRPPRAADQPPSVNLIGPTKLGFRCRDDVTEISRLLEAMGVRVNVVAPLGASPRDLLRIPEADANVNLAPEVGELTCDWLKRQFKQPVISTVPLGWGATRDFIAEVAETLQLDIDPDTVGESRLPWYSRSVDSTYLRASGSSFLPMALTLAAARMARDEMGFEVVGLGTYSRERARDVRALASEYGLEALITDDYLAVERAVAELQPELVLGTADGASHRQALGHSLRRDLHTCPCSGLPARYSPQMGFEGSNVIFDTWVHPLIMGLEEHLLTMFRDDFEFNDGAVPSHLGEGGGAHQSDNVTAMPISRDGGVAWAGIC